ncbi:unnamed protein product, partial [marine sediment metagenome]
TPSQIHSPEQMLVLVDVSTRNRATAATEMNKYSS